MTEMPAHTPSPTARTLDRPGRGGVLREAAGPARRLGTLLRDFVVSARAEGVQHRAGAWINTLPPGTSIGILAPLAPFRSPFFRFDRYRLVIDPHPDRGGARADPE